LLSFANTADACKIAKFHLARTLPSRASHQNRANLMNILSFSLNHVPTGMKGLHEALHREQLMIILSIVRLYRDYTSGARSASSITPG
jgi:hypothetical protein